MHREGGDTQGLHICQNLRYNRPAPDSLWALNFHISPARAFQVLLYVPTHCISNPSLTFLTYIRSDFTLLRNTYPLVCPSILQSSLIWSPELKLWDTNEQNLLPTLYFHQTGGGNDECPNMNANWEEDTEPAQLAQKAFPRLTTVFTFKGWICADETKKENNIYSSNRSSL